VEKFARRARLLEQPPFAFLQEARVLTDHITTIAGGENDFETGLLRDHPFRQFAPVYAVGHHDVG
jgi:hypothetical protein